jgi:RNA polymerase sigma-70 factor (ECF subfamily)
MDHGERLRWFAREVLPHEADVRKWLAHSIRGLTICDLDDVVQESYARLWTADVERIVNARAYLFVTARHVVGEAVRRSRIVSIEMMADIESMNIANDEITPERRLSSLEELERLRRVMVSLPPKCRQAFELKKFSGLSQREIAKRMNIAESTVEKHLAKALRLVMEDRKVQAGEPVWSNRSREPLRKKQ